MLTSSDLKELIAQKYGSQRAFAKAIGLNPNTLSVIIRKGLTNTSFENAAKICVALDISIEDIFGNLTGKISAETERKAVEAKKMYELYLADREIQPAINRLLGYQPPTSGVSQDNDEGGAGDDDRN